MEWNFLVHRPTINSQPLRQQSVKRLDLGMNGLVHRPEEAQTTIGRFFRPSDESETNAGDAPPDHAKEVSGATDANGADDGGGGRRAERPSALSEPWSGRSAGL